MIAFFGAGRMAGAMIGGLISGGVYQPAQIACTSAADGTGEALARRTGITYTSDPQKLLATADTVVLAFKPQQLKEISPEVAALATGKLLISILAGSTIDRLHAIFPTAGNIVRSMPNTPGMIGAGVTVYAPMNPLSAGERTRVESILGALGKVLTLPEPQLDAVTGVSGSGPAYVFEFVAALRDGGIAAGIDPETAYQLALQTVLGAAKLLENVPESPEQHRDWVSSPGGTTLAGLAVMRERNFRDTLTQTVLAATRRSRELAQG